MDSHLRAGVPRISPPKSKATAVGFIFNRNKKKPPFHSEEQKGGRTWQ